MRKETEQISNKNETSKKLIKEEEERMALLQYNQASIIKEGKEKAFFEKLNKNRPTQEFWDDFRKLRSSITIEQLNEADAIIDERIKDGK